MLQKFRERSQSESGFTLIELLVVMLIIGLLAAIAIPSFFNQRNKANDASAKEDTHTAQTAGETFATDNGGSYAPGGTAMTPAQLKTIEPALNNAVLAVPAATGNSYTVQVTSDTGNTFSISRASSGTLTYPCTIPSATADKGGCNVVSGTTGTWN